MPQDPSELPLPSREPWLTRSSIVRAGRSPLGFCVMALTIVEAFIGAAGTAFQLPLDWKIAFLGIGILLFAGVFATVIWLVVKHPRNLIYSEESHFQSEAMKYYGTERRRDHPIDVAPKPVNIAPTPPVGQIENQRGQ